MEPKTNSNMELLKTLGRNIKNIEVISPAGVNPHNLMKYENVIMDSKIVEKLQSMTS